MTPSVLEARKQIRRLMDDSDPADAPTAYYSLFHPPDRSTLLVHQDEGGKTTGFVGRFQTGVDLFRPLVTLKCPNPEATADLLGKALVVGRPYILFAGLNQLSMVGGLMEIENQRILRIYTIDPRYFNPQVNVMVASKRSHDGSPRCEIVAEGKAIAVAGLNWKSPAFAEIFVQVDSSARERGWGSSVVSCITEELLKNGIRPVYLVENGNEASLNLVEGLGYYDTGSRQVYADTVYTGDPRHNPVLNSHRLSQIRSHALFDDAR